MKKTTVKKPSVTIPEEIFSLRTISIPEQVLLSIYKYYTEKCSEHKCFISNSVLMDWLQMSDKTFKKSKKHLVDLGYIKSVRKILGKNNTVSEVIYLGVGEEITPTVGEEITPYNKE